MVVRCSVLACAFALVACASVPAPQTNVTPQGNAWEAHLGVDDRDARAFEELPPQGMRIVDVTGWTLDHQPHYASLWVFADVHGWDARRGIDGATLTKEDDAHARTGMHLIRLDGFALGAGRFTAIWELGDPADRAWKIDLDEEGLKQENEGFSQRGWQLVDLSAYADAEGEARWTGIWAPRTEGIETTTYLSLDKPSLQRTLADLPSKNERPIALDANVGDGAPRFTLLTSNALGPPWIARCDLDRDEWQRQMEDGLVVGYRPVRLTGYVVDESPRFCAIWSR